jgi:hypothetical protein
MCYVVPKTLKITRRYTRIDFTQVGPRAYDNYGNVNSNDLNVNVPSGKLSYPDYTKSAIALTQLVLINNIGNV